MDLWQLRQAIESSIPAWVVIPFLVFAVVVVVYGRFVHPRRRR